MSDPEATQAPTPAPILATTAAPASSATSLRGPVNTQAVVGWRRFPVVALRLLRFTGRVLSHLAKNHALLLAGGIAYNVMLSIVPLLTVLLAVLTRVLDRQQLLDIISTELALLIPSQAQTITDQVGALIDNADIIGGVGILVLLFFSTWAFKILEGALAIVFARTKLGTDELAEKLAARGFSAAAINGDVDQKMRERTIQRLKDGQIDILVATDVAARGLDVDRISHVLNYDIPYDTESYVHRIGRTGRAGRKGEAILFVAPRERGMLGAIERATRQKIEQMNLPSVDAVNERRVAKFLDKIEGALGSADLSVFRDLVERYEREKNVPAVEIAAALAQLVQGKTPLLLAKPAAPERAFEVREPRERSERPERGERPVRERAPREHAPREHGAPEVGMKTYRIEVGYQHGVQPGNIVGAIANEADLEARFIGRIDIRDDFTLVDLPDGMPADLLAHMQTVRVASRPLRMRPAESADIDAPKAKRSFGPPRGDRPGGGPRKPGGFKPRGPRF